MRLETLKWLENTRLAGEAVKQFAAGRSLSGYVGNLQLRSAVERPLGNAGEALFQLRRDDPGTAARISDYEQVIAFRHHLVHRHWDIRAEIVWNIIQRGVPRLIREVRGLLAEGDAALGDPPPGQPQHLDPAPPQEPP
jgi:uncharacterized protein with HEPN domain